MFRDPAVRAIVDVLAEAARREGYDLQAAAELVGSTADPAGLALLCYRLDLDPLEVLEVGRAAREETSR